jgi:hypothetical protein
MTGAIEKDFGEFTAEALRTQQGLQSRWFKPFKTFKSFKLFKLFPDIFNVLNDWNVWNELNDSPRRLA